TLFPYTTLFRSQNRSAEIQAGQIGVRQVRAGEIRACPALLSPEKPFVRLQNLRELFAVVLDAFRFSQSHNQFPFRMNCAGLSSPILLKPARLEIGRAHV